MSKAKREALTRPAPRELPAFQEAAERGLIPIVPEHPPTHPHADLVPTSRRMLDRWLVQTVGAAALYVALAWAVVGRISTPYYVHQWLFMALGVVGLFLVLRSISRATRRVLEETMHGYTTSIISFGALCSLGRTHKAWGGGDNGPPHSFDGVWVLDRNFKVQSTPNPNFDPPGFYPSPHEPEKWELWTGSAWTGTYREQPIERQHPAALVS